MAASTSFKKVLISNVPTVSATSIAAKPLVIQRVSSARPAQNVNNAALKPVRLVEVLPSHQQHQHHQNQHHQHRVVPTQVVVQPPPQPVPVQVVTAPQPPSPPRTLPSAPAPPPQPVMIRFTEQQLADLSLKELNHYLRGLSKEDAAEVKRLRRAAKNKSYAVVQREKRQDDVQRLTKRKMELQEEIGSAKFRKERVDDELHRLKKESTNLLALARRLKIQVPDHVYDLRSRANSSQNSQYGEYSAHSQEQQQQQQHLQ